MQPYRLNPHRCSLVPVAVYATLVFNLATILTQFSRRHDKALRKKVVMTFVSVAKWVLHEGYLSHACIRL